MNATEIPDNSYVQTWGDGRGKVKFFTRHDGSRLRYYTAGTGPPLVLLHTVRTQLDYFQRVIPLLTDAFTVYALDLPGMGWSDIVPGASYEEPDLRAAVVEFVALGLERSDRGTNPSQNISDVTLAGESMGAALALSASIELKDRVRRVAAFNPYDYPSGLERGNRFARFIGTAVRMPGSGPVFTRMENRAILRGVLRGGFFDAGKLPEDFLVELRRSGRRKGYPAVARAIVRSLNGFVQSRPRYADIAVPVTLVYSEQDWSRPSERDLVAGLLAEAERLTLPDTGHFSALERPADMARILRGQLS